MSIQAIVYTSNTGYTAEYACLLGERTAIPVYPLDKAAKMLAHGTEVIYLGWLMASMIKGYREAAKRWKIKIVCGVGLGASGSQLDEVRNMNKLPDETPLFTLQGGFDMTRLRGMNKFIMKMMRRPLIKQMSEKDGKTEDDLKMLDMLQNGGSAVDGRYLNEIVEKIKAQ